MDWLTWPRLWVLQMMSLLHTRTHVRAHRHAHTHRQRNASFTLPSYFNVSGHLIFLSSRQDLQMCLRLIISFLYLLYKCFVSVYLILICERFRSMIVSTFVVTGSCIDRFLQYLHSCRPLNKIPCVFILHMWLADIMHVPDQQVLPCSFSWEGFLQDLNIFVNIKVQRSSVIYYVWILESDRFVFRCGRKVLQTKYIDVFIVVAQVGVTLTMCREWNLFKTNTFEMHSTEQ